MTSNVPITLLGTVPINAPATDAAARRRGKTYFSLCQARERERIGSSSPPRYRCRRWQKSSDFLWPPLISHKMHIWMDGNAYFLLLEWDHLYLLPVFPLTVRKDSLKMLILSLLLGIEVIFAKKKQRS